MKLCQRREMQTERRHRKLVGSFAVWHNFMEFLDMALPPNHGQKTSWIECKILCSFIHRPPWPVPFVAFAQGDTTLARKALADTLGKQAKRHSLCSCSCPACWFYVSIKLGGCDEHQYVWDRPNLKLSIKLKSIVHECINIIATMFLLYECGRFETTQDTMIALMYVFVWMTLLELQ